MTRGVEFTLRFYWETYDSTYVFNAWNQFRSFPFDKVIKSYKSPSIQKAISDFRNDTYALIEAALDDAAARYKERDSLEKYINRAGRPKNPELSQVIFSLMNIYCRGLPPEFDNGMRVKDAARQVRIVLKRGAVEGFQADMTEAAIIQMWRRRGGGKKKTK